MLSDKNAESKQTQTQVRKLTFNLELSEIHYFCAFAIWIINQLNASTQSRCSKELQKPKVPLRLQAFLFVLIGMLYFAGYLNTQLMAFSSLRLSCVKAIKLILLKFSLCKCLGRSILCPQLSQEVSPTL